MENVERLKRVWKKKMEFRYYSTMVKKLIDLSLEDLEIEKDDIEQRGTEVKEVDENNGADSVLEEDDQVMEIVNVVKDDGLMMVDMEYDGGESLEDTDTSVKMEEIDCQRGLERTRCTHHILRIQHTHQCLDQT